MPEKLDEIEADIDLLLSWLKYPVEQATHTTDHLCSNRDIKFGLSTKDPLIENTSYEICPACHVVHTFFSHLTGVISQKNPHESTRSVSDINHKVHLLMGPAISDRQNGTGVARRV